MPLSHGPRPRPARHIPPSPLAGRGVPTRLRSTPPPPPPPGRPNTAAAVPGGMDRRGERKGDGSMRSDRDERGERGKKKKKIIIIISPVPTTRCHLALHQLGDLLRGAWRWRWIALGGRHETPPPPVGRRRLLRIRADGRNPPFPAPPHHGGRQQAPAHGERRRLLLSLTDGSRPSSTQAASSELDRPPGNSLQRTASSVHGDGLCSPCSMAPRIPHSGEGSLTARSSFFPGFGTNVTRFNSYGKKEAGTGEHSTF